MVPSIQLKSSGRSPVILSEKNLDLAAVIGEVAGILYFAAQKELRERHFLGGEAEATSDQKKTALFKTADQAAIIAALITGGVLPPFRPPPRQRALTGYTEKDLEPAMRLLEDAIALYNMVYGTLLNTPLFNTATGGFLTIVRN
jgi:hypothetical protein